MRPPKQAGAGGFHLVIVRTANGPPGDQNDVPAWTNLLHPQPHDLPEPPLDAVANDCAADAAVDRKPEATVRSLIRQCTEHHQLMAVGAALPADFLEALIFSDAIKALHAGLSSVAGTAIFRTIGTDVRTAVSRDAGVPRTRRAPAPRRQQRPRPRQTCAQSTARPTVGGRADVAAAAHSDPRTSPCESETRACAGVCGPSVAKFVLLPFIESPST